MDMTGIGNPILYSYTASKTAVVPKNVKQVIGNFAKSDDNAAAKADVSKMRRVLRSGAKNLAKETNTPVIDNMQLYAKALKKQRMNNNDVALEKKKVKYSFKKISSKIISSKTSTAAREAVSQAKREIQKLKAARRSGKYDPEEIEAALDHAKAMERIARKKVKHLEEEEMAAAARRGKRDPLTDEKYEDKYDEKCEEDEDFEDYGDDVEDPEELREYEEELLEYDDSELSDASFEDELSFINGMGETVRDLSEELVDEIEALLEEIGLDDLTDSLLSVDTDMDAADLKELKMKHRNKEMKEMVEADAKYLKAVFEHLAKLKAGGSGIPGMSGGKSAMPSGISFSANPGVSAAAVAAFTPAPEASAPVIDIAL